MFSEISNRQINKAEDLAGRILLLADDGQMAELLDRTFAGVSDCQVQGKKEVFEGIMQLGSGDFQLVLVNAEKLSQKTTQVTKALRQVRPKVRLVLYGPAYAEIYSRSALDSYADDYLTWPIGAGQLRQQLRMGNAEALPDDKDKFMTMSARDLLGDESMAADEMAEQVESPRQTSLRADRLSKYHQLAQLVGQGPGALVKKAQQVLAQLLEVEWVRIDLLEQEDKSEQTNSVGSGGAEGLAVPLMSLRGPVGQMSLGPPSGDKQSMPPKAVIEQVSGFLGTILYLAQRDESLKHLATVDDLTGAYNRRYLEYFMRQILEQSKNNHTDMTLLLFDIDNFKHFNDTYGHTAGDKVLCQTTVLIKRCCREHDVVARFGGDEFAVLFWDSGTQRTIFEHQNQKEVQQGEPTDWHKKSHSEQVMFMSNRFRRIMTTSGFPSIGPEAHGVLTISGGLARHPWDGRTVEELLNQADQALLSAKRQGKNRIYLVGRPV